MKTKLVFQDEILMETATRLRARLGSELDAIQVQRAVIGIFYTGVKLSSWDGGLCFTPVKEIPEAVCCPSSARAMPDSGKLTGRPVSEHIDRLQQGGPIQRALTIAMLNALSACCWRKKPPSGYYLAMGKDPVENKAIPDDAVVVVVGALVPYIRMLKRRGGPFYILEKDPRTLKADEMAHFCPQEKAGECIASADLVIITGATLINGTLESILDGMRGETEAILVGPTASMLPEAYFNRGINTIGGIVVTEPDEMLDTLAQGGSGYHFYGKSAERFIIGLDY